MSSVDTLLKEFYKVKKENKENPAAKGEYGELAVMQALQEYMEGQKGFIFHSYAYPYQKDRNTGAPLLGNIKYEYPGKNAEEREAAKQRGEKRRFVNKEDGTEEIDCLIVTERAIIPVEVKAYSQTITFYDHWWNTSSSHDENSPVSQTEKHCRHLYHLIAEKIPEGLPYYIAPLVCFMDMSLIADRRSDMSKGYIRLTSLNDLKYTVSLCDTEREYLIPVEDLLEYMKSKATSYKSLYTYL